MIKRLITWKRVLLLLLFLFLLAASNYAGGYIGFNQGYETAMYSRDSDAYSTSLALRMLRKDDYEGAIDLLETRLDLEIMQCDVSKEPYKSPYNIYTFVLRQSPQEAHGHLLSEVAEYRSKHPSPSGFLEVRQRIESILAEASRGVEKAKDR